ncbi:hypothetical protein DSOUD_0821 [Desulfuromonas soudanensis]|uniref:Uncharacterized protein n=1 Tax=Desulfuromonas soudanensis TaxID=1603606 RepID=A0A0M4CZT3_9BACT|nr:hypothetical protein [Desulfuromonas soudanensis]ALC15608.1 hypothetical protein DSOUD_0821 [Desulfuromonas soudanensis]
MAYDTVDDAFHFVSDAPPGERSAVVRRTTGEVFLASFKAGYDERPDGFETNPDYRTIPHRQDLDPGKALVLEFIRSRCPAELTRVEALFARSGAFRNVKDLLRRQHLLESWQVFESQRIETLLRQWCEDQGLRR